MRDYKENDAMTRGREQYQNQLYGYAEYQRRQGGIVIPIPGDPRDTHSSRNTQEDAETKGADGYRVANSGRGGSTPTPQGGYPRSGPHSTGTGLYGGPEGQVAQYPTTSVAGGRHQQRGHFGPLEPSQQPKQHTGISGSSFHGSLGSRDPPDFPPGAYPQSLQDPSNYPAGSNPRGKYYERSAPSGYPAQQAPNSLYPFPNPAIGSGTSAVPSGPQTNTFCYSCGQWQRRCQC